MKLSTRLVLPMVLLALILFPWFSPTQQVHASAPGWTLDYTSSSQVLKPMVVYNNKIYAGGFESYQEGGKLYVYDGSSWKEITFDTQDGATLNMIEAMKVFEGRLYIGVRVYNGGYFSRIYSYNGTEFKIDYSTAGTGGCSGFEDFAIHNNAIYAANGACGRGGVFIRNPDGFWTPFGDSMEMDGGAAVRALVSHQGALYAGTGVSGNHAKLWRWSGTKWELTKDFYGDPVFGYPDGIRSLASFNNQLYVGFASYEPLQIPVFNGQDWVSSLTIPGCADVKLSVTGGMLFAGSCSGNAYINLTGSWTKLESLPVGGVSEFAQLGNRIYTETIFPGSIYSMDTPVSTFGNPHDNWSALVNKTTNCDYGSKKCLEPQKYHTGIDSYGPYASTPVYAAGPGVVRLFPMGPQDKKTKTWPDHGLGNVVIIEHALPGGNKVYSLYAQLASISPALSDGACIDKGTQLGIMGSSGYGQLKYAKYGKTPYLHLEFKSKPVLGDPLTGQNFGYTNTFPDNWGYADPKLYLGNATVINCPFLPANP